MSQTHFHSEDRPTPATRTRLRSGKLFDLDKKPICECTLYDLEDGDIGIVVAETELSVPDRVLIQDDKDLTLAFTQIRWRMGPYLFGAYLEPPIPLGMTARS
ncbi:hypothetical protein [Roseibium marinum]|uniref:PilZ domain-containing protein n=1 Tax=Roseibium marinum TaxID=281252 RepID=A0A2S3UVJ1_9HYPH|nr:hypothetical protein [Roseibium marinum]POF31745.1 hypothetical protein CLV41_104315 [Roseibium marinum]